jgi:hypothetical protein
MYYRLRLFIFALTGNFEKLLEREIAKVDISEYTRRPGVLVARGLVAPTIGAVYKAARLALHAESPFSRHQPGAWTIPFRPRADVA